MALVKKLGQDLSASHGAVTGQSESHSDNDTLVITLQGPYAAFTGHVPVKGDTHTNFAYIPENSYVESSKLASDGKGGGTLTVNCIFPGDKNEQTATPSKVTYRIEMAEERTDLVAHPALESVVDICLKWLATNDGQKTDGNGGYQYDAGDGTFMPVTDTTAQKFCAAWMHGIKTYNRYFPVVEKISEYKSVPGLSMSGASITSGTASFSGNIGTWDDPGIGLAGYGSTGYFKSKDSWVQNANTSWTRTEQWVWTPDGSSSTYGWIYSSSGGGGAS